MLEADVSGMFPERPPWARRISVHAFGLLQPSHMEWTEDGRLLVSEFGRGNIFDITAGGDYRDAKPFASGLAHPAGILTNYEGSRIIVADTGRGEIVDITGGGHRLKENIVGSSIPGAYGLTLFRDKLFTAFSSETENGVARVTGGSFTEGDIHFGGFPNGNRNHPAYLSFMGACPTNWSTVAFNDRLLYVHSSLGAIYDVSEEAVFTADTPKFVEGLDEPLGMIYHEPTKLLYIADRGSGSVKPIPSGGEVNMRFVSPVATGFRRPSCVRFHPARSVMYVCDMAECVVWTVEL